MKNERSVTAIQGLLERDRASLLCVLAGIAIVAIAVSAGLRSSHAQSSPAQTASSDRPAIPTTNSAGVEASAAGKQAQQATPPTAESLQQQQVANEAANLLKMATDLKAAVDKTTKDTLSVGVVRKAGEIEQLAHKVRTGSGKG
jgi:hypothetical protein